MTKRKDLVAPSASRGREDPSPAWPSWERAGTSSPSVSRSCPLARQRARVYGDRFDFLLLIPGPTNVIANGSQPLMGKVRCSLPACLGQIANLVRRLCSGF